MEYEVSPFKYGYWVWNNDQENVKFERIDEGATSFHTTLNISTKGPTREVKFRETYKNLEQIRFKRYYQRVCKTLEPEVITIQDIKDIVLFSANVKDVTKEFIKFFHLPSMDRFLRALIVYFQYYIQVWERVLEKRIESKRKIYQPRCKVLEEEMLDDLADLRSMVAREYGRLLLGLDDAAKFHHVHAMLKVSLSDKDRKLYETLYCYSVRVVWTALQRRFLGLIELEMNHMFRTDFFNIIAHHEKHTAFNRTPAEQRIFAGNADKYESKLSRKSGATKELIYGKNDYRLLAIGITQFTPMDERTKYLEAAYSAPEEKLIELKVRVGMLGLNRKDYDPMLTQRERTSQNYDKPIVEAPEFKLPPKTKPTIDSIPTVFPKKGPMYVETNQTTRNRSEQQKKWISKLHSRTGYMYF